MLFRSAQILGKPVVIVPGIDYNWGIPSILKTKSCIISSTDNLSENLNRLLNDVNFRSSVLFEARAFLKQLISFQGMASQKLYKFLIESE